MVDTREIDQRVRLCEIITEDSLMTHLLECVRRLDFPQWRLASGAVYQTVWNHLTGRDPLHGIKDFDIIYFNDGDLSYDAEDREIRRLAAAIPDFPKPIELRNQARVHFWFEKRFGETYSPLPSADASLLRYAARVHAVAVRLEPDGRLDIAAPFGLSDVFAMVIRPNRVIQNAASYSEKAARMKSLWPELTVIDW